VHRVHILGSVKTPKTTAAVELATTPASVAAAAADDVERRAPIACCSCCWGSSQSDDGSKSKPARFGHASIDATYSFSWAVIKSEGKQFLVGLKQDIDDGICRL